MEVGKCFIRISPKVLTASNITAPTIYCSVDPKKAEFELNMHQSADDFRGYKSNDLLWL